MIWRQIYELLEPGVTSVVQNNKMGTIFKSDQEEADTKMLLHALDATANGAMELYIHSPDTGVSCASKVLSGAVCEDIVCVCYEC